MEAGYLNQYFKAVAVKRLSAVEADAAVSNQHEYNGVSMLRKMFGTDGQKMNIPTHFIYVTDDDSTVSADGELTWYDAMWTLSFAFRFL